MIDIKKNINLFFVKRFYVYYLIILSFVHINILIQSILLFLLILILTIWIGLDQLFKNIQKGNIVNLKNLIFINISLSSFLELFAWSIDLNSYKSDFYILNVNIVYLFKSYLFFLYFNFIILLLSNLNWIIKNETKINNEINKSINYYANKKNLYLFFFIIIFLFVSLYSVDFFGYRNLTSNYDLDAKKQLFSMFVKSLPIVLGVIIFKNKLYINKLLAFLIFIFVILYFFNFGRREVFYSIVILGIPIIYLNTIKINFHFIFQKFIYFFFFIIFIFFLFYLFEIIREDKMLNSSYYSISEFTENLSERTKKFHIFAELYSYEIKNFYPYHLLSNLVYSIPEVFISNKMSYLSQEAIMNKIFGTNYRDINFYNELAAFNDFHFFGVVAYPILIVFFWIILINLVNFIFNIQPRNSKILTPMLISSLIFFYFLENGESYNFIVNFRDLFIMNVIYYLIFFFSYLILKHLLKVK